MKADPLVSIVLPTYNRPELLRRAIDSVLAQTRTDWELIIIDDCSTIDINESISSYLNHQIRLLKTPVNMGPSGSRNLGIQNAHPHSKYIALLDDDDTFRPEFLMKSLSAMESTGPDIGFSWTGVNYIYPERNKTETFFWDPKFQNREAAYYGFLEKRFIGTGYGIIIKKEVFLKVGYFDEALKAVVDTDFFLRVLQHYFYVNIPDVLINIYRHTGEKVNMSSLKRIEALEIIIQKHHEALANHFNAWFNFRSKILSMYAALNDKKAMRNYAWRIMTKERFSVKFLMQLLRLELKRLSK